MTRCEIDVWASAVMWCYLMAPTGPRSNEENFYDLWLVELNAARHGYTLARKNSR